MSNPENQKSQNQNRSKSRPAPTSGQKVSHGGGAQSARQSSHRSDCTRGGMSYADFDAKLKNIKEIALKEIEANGNLTRHCSQLTNDLSMLRTELTSTKESYATEQSRVQKSVDKLSKELSDKEGLITYLEKQTGGEASQKLRDLQKQVQALTDEVEKLVEKAVMSVIHIEGDVGAFSDKFLGNRIFCYPEVNEIVLTKGNPEEIRLYDLMGLEFSNDQNTLKCTVVQKGWRDSVKVWVEAKLSVASE